MRRALNVFWIILIFVGFTDCTDYSDSTYFNGEIREIDSRKKEVKEVKLKPVVLDGAYFGSIAVHDSLMIFWNPKLQSHFFNIFNLDTGEEIGSFCNKGQGPDEVVAISIMYQIFEEGNELKTLLFAANEKKILIWNITRSLAEHTTVIDTVIPYSCNTKDMGACYDYIFRQSEDILFTHIPSMTLNDEDASLPFYQERTLYSDKTLMNYPIFRRSIKNDKASIIPEAFFNSIDAFKPSGSKIAQVMKRLHQLNIIDTETGEVIGYRLAGSPDFTIFKKKNAIINTNFVRVQADDQYIYASFWGRESWGRFDIPSVNIIHVFDWNGKWLYELITDQPVHEMWLDKVRNRLYTTNVETDEVFYLDLNEIILTGR